MRILLIGNYTLDQQPSMQLYAVMLEKVLRESACHVEVWKPEACIAMGKWSGYYDKFVHSKKKLAVKLEEFARESCDEPYVVHICDHSNSVYYPLVKNYPHSISCHDLMAIQSALGLHPQSQTRFTGKILQSWILRNLKEFTHVACMSENTQKDLSRLSEPKHCPVIYSALNGDFELKPDAAIDLYEKYRIREGTRIIFNLSSNSWYKNRVGLIRSFASLCGQYTREEVCLIIAGAPLGNEQVSLCKELGVYDRIRFVEKPSHEDLVELYHFADLFLFPSRYEGFGWPSLEAQACGTPVVAGRGGSQQEVLRNSALLPTFYEPEMFAKNCEQILQDSEVRDELIQRGFNNLKRFQVEPMTEAYVEFFEKVYEDFA